MSRQTVGVKGFADMLIEDISPQTVLDEIDQLIDFPSLRMPLRPAPPLRLRVGGQLIRLS